MTFPAAALVSLLWTQVVAPPAPPVVASPAASAPPLPIELRWDAPPDCPSLATLRVVIARGLPSAPAGMAANYANMYAGVVVTALDADHWLAALDLRGPDWTATRALKGATCAAVTDAAALVIGLALTSELEAREVLATPPPRPPPAPSTPFAALAVAADAGTLPTATPGGALSLGWRFTHARVELQGSLFESRAATTASRPDTGGRLSLVSLAARGCALWGRAVSFGPCVGAGVDRLHGAGTGPIAAGAATSFAPFAAGGLQGAWRLSRWVGPFLTVEAAIPLVRARFSVENVGLVHQPADVSFRGAAGLEIRFR